MGVQKKCDAFMVELENGEHMEVDPQVKENIHKCSLYSRWGKEFNFDFTPYWIKAYGNEREQGDACGEVILKINDIVAANEGTARRAIVEDDIFVEKSMVEKKSITRRVLSAGSRIAGPGLLSVYAVKIIESLCRGYDGSPLAARLGMDMEI